MYGLSKSHHTFLLPSCQFTAYMKVSMSWPDAAFCFMPGASHHHWDDVGCTGTPFRPNNVYISIEVLSYVVQMQDFFSPKRKRHLAEELFAGSVRPQPGDVPRAARVRDVGALERDLGPV
jgi:hypothetical protein